MSQEPGQPGPFDTPQSFPPAPQGLPPVDYGVQQAYAPAPLAPYGQSPAQDVAGPAKVLGIFYIVLAVLGFVIALFIGAIIAMMPMSNPGGGQAVPAGATAALVTIMSLFVGLLAGVLPLVTGIGLIKGASWGRILAIVNGALILISIPFGTLLGGFTLYFMLRAGAKEGWDQLSRRAPSAY